MNSNSAAPRSLPALHDVRRRLAGACAALDPDAGAWPGEQFRWLAEAGVLGWVIPRHFGGGEVSQTELMQGYLRLSRACLVTTFVLTQRNAACQRIAGSDNDDLKSELLPPLCDAATFATVGISHLTTSRQHVRKPVVQVQDAGVDLVLDGMVPWVTGANYADHVVTGGTCEDGRQVLLALPMEAGGVDVQPPSRLLALNASQTASIQLQGVRVPRRYLLAGPIEQVMKGGRGGGAGSITTSSLAIGHAGAALARLKEEAGRRPDLVEICEPMRREVEAVQQDLLSAAEGESPDDNPQLAPESIRQRANSLVLRATQAYLAASKGAGFVAGHPAERMLREAMFFLVWSCPQPVLTAALREFACVIEGDAGAEC